MFALCPFHGRSEYCLLGKNLGVGEAGVGPAGYPRNIREVNFPLHLRNIADDFSHNKK